MSGLPIYSWPELRRNEAAVGGYGPWNEVYGLMSISRLLFYSEGMKEQLGDYNSYEELGFDTARMAKWHPFNRGLALGIRVMLPGMLLLCKGDRVAMHSSVETRYPFLDDDLISYSCQLHPRWKLRRFRERVQLSSAQSLPHAIAARRQSDAERVSAADSRDGRGRRGVCEESRPHQLRRRRTFSALRYSRGSSLAERPLAPTDRARVRIASLFSSRSDGLRRA